MVRIKIGLQTLRTQKRVLIKSSLFVREKLKQLPTTEYIARHYHVQNVFRVTLHSELSVRTLNISCHHKTSSNASLVLQGLVTACFQNWGLDLKKSDFKIQEILGYTKNELCTACFLVFLSKWTRFLHNWKFIIWAASFVLDQDFLKGHSIHTCPIFGICRPM